MNSKNFPPINLEDAKHFSVCENYKSYVICIYCAGSTSLSWSYIIYKDDIRFHFNEMPGNPSKVAYEFIDCLQHCRKIIDVWDNEISRGDKFIEPYDIPF